jgi:hypothetical protein
MKIKTIISALVGLVVFAGSFGVQAQSGLSSVEPLFEYPKVPDQLTKVNMRSNYMVLHLWDECPLDKEDITNVESFRETFSDFVSFFVLADYDEVEKGVKKFVDNVAKNKTNLNSVLGFVDTEIFAPQSRHWSDDVYTIFAKALLDNRKVDKNVKAMLETNLQMLANSKLDTQLGNLTFVKPRDGKATLYDLTSEYVFVFFNDGSVDDSIYKLRLNTDVATNTLIKNGNISIVSVYSGTTPDAKLEGEPENWYVAKLDNMQQTYDMRVKPTLYILSKDKKILAKSPAVSQILGMTAQMKAALNL